MRAIGFLTLSASNENKEEKKLDIRTAWVSAKVSNLIHAQRKRHN